MIRVPESVWLMDPLSPLSKDQLSYHKKIILILKCEKVFIFSFSFKFYLFICVFLHELVIYWVVVFAGGGSFYFFSLLFFTHLSNLISESKFKSKSQFPNFCIMLSSASKSFNPQLPYQKMPVMHTYKINKQTNE